MAFTVDTDDLGSLSDPPAAGDYHVSIINVDEEGGTGGEMVVEMEVLAGTVKDMEGRTYRAYYRHQPNFSKFFHRLAMNTGIITQAQIESAKAKGEGIEYDFKKAEGRQIMIRLEDDEYEGKKTLKMAPFHTWSVDDPTCAKWPKNEKMLKKAGYVVDKAAKEETAAKSKEDDLADLI